MNIILFQNDEIITGIPSSDYRAVHIKTILKLDPGDSFRAGIVGGPLGAAVLNKKGDYYHFSFEADSNPFPSAPIQLVCGLPRPPVARRLLKDAVTAGVSAIHFITVENGEKSYAQSKLWTTDDHIKAMMEGAQQGGNTLLPDIHHWKSVSHMMQKVQFDGDLIILDNVTGSVALSDHLEKNQECKNTVIAVGAERGWTENERKRFSVQGFRPCILGPRILRTEAAVTASIIMAENIKKI